MLTVAGQKLSGNFTLHQGRRRQRPLTLSNVKLELGNGTHDARDRERRLGRDPAPHDGIAAQITNASIALAPSLTNDFTFTGSVSLSINNDPVRGRDAARRHASSRPART